MYHIASLLLIVFFKFCYKLQLIGHENVPKKGGCVIACTHTGWLDVLWLGVAVWPRPINYMAKKELFDNPILSWFLKQLKAFPVNRDNPGPSSLKIPLKILRQGEILGIFPSGTRTQSEVPLKRGAVTIALQAGVPLIPAVYLGPARVQIRHLFRRVPITIVFGEPIKPINQPKTKASKGDRDEIMDQLNNSFAELLNIAHSAHC